jgi:hypothetical protein
VLIILLVIVLTVLLASGGLGLRRRGPRFSSSGTRTHRAPFSG